MRLANGTSESYSSSDLGIGAHDWLIGGSIGQSFRLVKRGLTGHWSNEDCRKGIHPSRQAFCSDVRDRLSG
jgi:hypothetical protein